MKKEIFIAVFLGGSLGVLMAFLVLFKTIDIKLDKNKKTVPKVPTSIVKNIEIKKQEIIPLEILEPNNGLIVNESFIVIKGKATKDSLIIIQSPIKDSVFKNEKEEFSFNQPLALGENLINIVVYPKGESTSQEKVLKIYYLKENL